MYCHKQHQDKLRRAMGDLKEMDFAIDSFGTQVIYYEESHTRMSEPTTGDRPAETGFSEGPSAKAG